MNKLIPNSEVLNSNKIGMILYSVSCIDVIYPGIGHNLDLINKYANENKIMINFIYRKEDLKYWSYANSGFHKFKKLFHN